MKHVDTSTAQTEKTASTLRGLPIVNVWYGGHSIGLYRVSKVEARALVLNHGGISFPVGTPLDVVDFQRLIPHAPTQRLSAMVVDNNRSGIQLAW